MRFKTRSHWKRRLQSIPEPEEFERAELDRMIAATKAANSGQVKMGAFCDEVPIPGLGKTRVWIYHWMLNGERQGMIGWLPYGASEERRAAYQASLIKYFASRVNPKTVELHHADGTVTTLKQ